MLDYETATKFIKYIKKRNSTLNLKVAGSYRRKLPKINDVDLLLVSKGPSWPNDSNPISKIKINIISQDNGELHRLIKTSFDGHTFICDVTKVNKKDLPFQLFHLTGDKGENIGFRQIAANKGWILNQYGIWYRDRPTIRVKGSEKIKNEKDIFEFLGKTYKPPEERIHKYY